MAAMTRFTISGIVAVVVVGAAFGFLWLRRQPAAGPRRGGAPVNVVLGAETSMINAAIWVAQSKGYFARAGLDVAVREFDSGKLCFEAMLEGTGVDIATVAPTPIMFESFARDDFAIIATLAYSYDDVKVIVRKDHGIERAVDLRGRKVGITEGTTGQFFLDAFLTDNEILASDVTTDGISPAHLPAALADGRVDAIVAWEPHAQQALLQLPERAARLLGTSPKIYKETLNLVAMKESLVTRRDVLVAFLTAVNEATTFLRAHEAEVQELVARKTGLDHAMTAAVWGDFVFELSLDQSLIRTLEREGLWAIRHELVSKVTLPNYLDYVHLPTLRAVRPEAVTIYK